ncbi:hypothetical protein LSAT2_002771 [Lamellibrachia satsuma]|nr:hypothetical protein LSAT2_002771 [Lamellibrachia satsuma]
MVLTAGRLFTSGAAFLDDGRVQLIVRKNVHTMFTLLKDDIALAILIRNSTPRPNACDHSFQMDITATPQVTSPACIFV